MRSFTYLNNTLPVHRQGHSVVGVRYTELFIQKCELNSGLQFPWRVVGLKKFESTLNQQPQFDYENIDLPLLSAGRDHRDHSSTH